MEIGQFLSAQRAFEKKQLFLGHIVCTMSYPIDKTATLEEEKLTFNHESLTHKCEIFNQRLVSALGEECLV